MKRSRSPCCPESSSRFQVCKALAACITASALGLASGQAHADNLIDTSRVRPPRAEERKLVQPRMAWIVHDGAPGYCARVKDKDGYVARPESCVYWNLRESRCVMVTRSPTSHSELGHLKLACISRENR
jgi:hypothetical protein